ncbi:LOW QUALITY PROTEIN: cytoplasmic dynein 1 light intermediate chain 2-like [Pomacea canaliculata]|uniref:LOW QUALITY PROTEIN: cytoplasmic dynein 1 light intermediate chain 2-like n=1 Tax=Pomacea canaliculata TaxID=400727 RepID=UPI000D735FAF|nr:LOW QUALITY PROTEIN: cytoplasmic dynein 1 light intermediate chain 2-like [Pomacea canaliculata]
MAPIGEDRMGHQAADGSSREDAQNLWASILSEVQSSSASKLSTNRSLLVLGDNECGKTTLIAKLQGMEDPKKGAGLEYYYIDVRDEYRDEQARLNVWVLDGDQSHTGLLKYALTEENFADTLVLLVASMAQPWFIAEALNKWLTVLREHIDKLRIPPEQMREYEQSLVRFYQDYQEPEESQTSSPAPPRGDANPLHPSAPVSDEEKVVLPLSPNTLTQNLGIPIVVVLTKCDAVSTLEKEHDFREEHFDFIQQYIRKFCLKFGAALFYTSVKDERNCELLYRYLVHRIYGFPFSTSAYVVERDSVFVPSGWDNEKKISILYENMTSVKPDDNFEDTIVKPILRKSVQRDAEVVAEDEQIFLMKQQTQLAKQPAAGQPGEPATPRAARPPTQRTPERAGAAQTSPMRGKDSKGAPPGAATEGMLANFFNSLLNKKTGAAVAGKDKAAVTRDAAAELERMTRGKKTVSETNSNDTGASGS